MARQRPGLQKNISSIFDGISVPSQDEQEQSGASGSKRARPAALKSSAGMGFQPAAARSNSSDYSRREPQKPQSPAAKLSSSVPKVIHLPPSRQGGGHNRKPGVMLVVTGIFLAAVVALIINSFLIAGDFGHQGGKLDPEEQISSVLLTKDVDIKWELPAALASLPRDPFEVIRPPEPVAVVEVIEPVEEPLPEPVVEEPVETVQLAVRGIVYSADNPSAVIGDQTVHEGDEISGITVVKINRKDVEFEQDGKRWVQKVQR